MALPNPTEPTRRTLSLRKSRRRVETDATDALYRGWMSELPSDIRALLDAPNYVHLTTLRADGSPRNWVVWVGLEDDSILVCTGVSAWKAKDMIRDPRVSLSVTANDDPYRMGAIQARVVEMRDDYDSVYMDAISHKYTGEPFAARGEGRVCFVLEPVLAGGRKLNLVHAPGE